MLQHGLTLLKARHEISQTQKDKVLHDPALHEVSSAVKDRHRKQLVVSRAGETGREVA